jgi:hypothetical protein
MPGHHEKRQIRKKIAPVFNALCNPVAMSSRDS